MQIATLSSYSHRGKIILKQYIAGSLTALALAGCGGSSTGVMNLVEAPTSSAGYAGSSVSLLNPSQTVTSNVTLLNRTIAPANVEVLEFQTTISATSTADTFTVTAMGHTYTVAWDSSIGAYAGTTGSTSIQLYPYNSNTAQLGMYWVRWDPDTSVDNGGAFGPTVVGVNTSPAMVEARSGSAKYSGGGIIAVKSDNEQFYASADGTATLTANFDSNTIGGQINVSNINTAQAGSVAIPDTTVVINQTSFSGNAFETTVSIAPADFGLQSAGTIDASGMFYETGATGVGGTFLGEGIAADGTTSVHIIGGFAVHNKG